MLGTPECLENCLNGTAAATNFAKLGGFKQQKWAVLQADRDPGHTPFACPPPLWPRSHLPAVAVAFESVVHEDVSSGHAGPVAGHGEHGAGDEVVPGEGGQRRGLVTCNSGGNCARSVSAPPDQGSLGHQAPVHRLPESTPTPHVPHGPHCWLDGRARGKALG